MKSSQIILTSFSLTSKHEIYFANANYSHNVRRQKVAGVEQRHFFKLSAKRKRTSLKLANKIQF